MSSVTFSATVGGDGSTVTDDSNSTTGLASGGHRTRFVPALAQMVAIATYLNGITAGVSDGVWSVVRLASTTNVALTGEQTIDGTLTATSRVLLTGQTTGSENGIYVTGAGAWARATDADVAAEFRGSKIVSVGQGTANRGLWRLSNNSYGPYVVGTTTLFFERLPITSLAYTQSAAITMSGAAFNEAHGANIASAATLNLDTATGNYVFVTGAVTVTAITLADGAERWVRFSSSPAPLITNGASLVTTTGANIQMSQDDVACFRGEAAGVVRMTAYTKSGVGSPMTQGKQTIPVPASGMTARITTGAGPNVTETTTNKVILATMDFDGATIEYAQFAVPMPKSWNLGTVSAKFHWTAASGSGTVIWGIQARAFNDNTALDGAFGTAQTATDTLLTANNEHISPETAAMTVAGTPAAECLVIFQVYRDAPTDTHTVDARLLAVDLYYTTNASNDV